MGPTKFCYSGMQISANLKAMQNIVIIMASVCLFEQLTVYCTIIKGKLVAVSDLLWGVEEKRLLEMRES